LIEKKRSSQKTNQPKSWMETTVEMLFVKGSKASTKERQQEWWQAQHQLQ
jgi:hypothetical protein